MDFKHIFKQVSSPLAILIWIIVCTEIYNWKFFEQLNLDYTLLIVNKNIYSIIMDSFSLGIFFLKNPFLLSFLVIFMLVPIYRNFGFKDFHKSEQKSDFFSKFNKLIFLEFKLRFPYKRVRKVLSLNRYYFNKLEEFNISKWWVVFKFIWNAEFFAVILALILHFIFKDGNRFIINLIVNIFIINFLLGVFLYTPILNEISILKHIRRLIIPIFLFLLFGGLGVMDGKEYANEPYEKNFSLVKFYSTIDSSWIKTDSSFTVLMRTNKEIILRDHIAKTCKFYPIRSVRNLSIGEDINLQ